MNEKSLPPHFCEPRFDLQGKSVLLIGSGADLDGRDLGSAIDSKERAGFDLIARVNKKYGKVEDVGKHVDILFVCRHIWAVRWWLKGEENEIYRQMNPLVIAFREGVGVSCKFERESAEAVGLKKTSTGLNAARWLVEQGAKVTVIGFGYRDGKFPIFKTYTESKKIDANPNYNWRVENEWLKNNVTLI